jgi:hypothetical protein
MCNAMVKELHRRAPAGKLQYVALNDVSKEFSSLIEGDIVVRSFFLFASFFFWFPALKEGQGLGRISTLEAIGLFLKEAKNGDDSILRALRCAMQPLVDAIMHGKSQALKKPETVTLKKQWVDMMQRAAKDVPFAVRFCPVCGENLATPLRFRDHLEGRKHCENVLVRVVVSGEVQMGDELTEADAFRLHREYCTFEKPEPPDVAMMMLTAAFDEIKEKRGHVSVPAGFRAELCFSFNVEKHRIRQVVCEFFPSMQVWRVSRRCGSGALCSVGKCVSKFRCSTSGVQRCEGRSRVVDLLRRAGAAGGDSTFETNDGNCGRKADTRDCFSLPVSANFAHSARTQQRVWKAAL